VRTGLLISVALLLPLAWGWGTYRVLAILWPERRSSGDTKRDNDGSRETVIDYQI
jgi:hypothetical protein